MSFFFTKSKSLKFGSRKRRFSNLRDKGGVLSVEDEVISLLPNMPGGNDKDLHEERVSKMLLSMHYHLEEITCKVLMRT
jgi:hypothetical protein